MAKLKKSAKAAASAAPQAERLAKTISESAQQIWLAGVGAFGRAQTEGTRLFEGLVKEGLSLESSVRHLAGGRADKMREAVETRVDQARERAADTWDKLEKVFEQRVQTALARLNVPGRDDLESLTKRVDTLTSELRQLRGGKPAAKRPAQAAKKAVRKAPARKAPAKRARKA
jgi:poly(hydroxyalkanoate) granule-associated protein